MTDEYVNPDDLRVTRNSEGRVLPVDEEAGTLGTVKVTPMAYGDVQEFFGDGDSSDVSEEDMAELFDRFLVKPDLSEDAGGEVTAEYINEMYPLVPRDLLMAILSASGVDAEVEMSDEDNSAEVDVGN